MATGPLSLRGPAVAKSSAPRRQMLRRGAFLAWCPQPYLVVTLMVLGLISSCLGMVSVSRPLSKLASALSA